MDIQAIINLIQGSGLAGNLDPVAVWTSLTSPHVSGTVPAPIYESELLGAVAGLGGSPTGSAAQLAAIITHPTFPLLKKDIESANRTGLMLWVQVYRSLPAPPIDADTAAALIAILSGSQTDTRSLAERAGISDLPITWVERAVDELHAQTQGGV